LLLASNHIYRKYTLVKTPKEPASRSKKIRWKI
jgi:hypothetical protein